MGVAEPVSERAYYLEVLDEASLAVQEILMSGYTRIGRGSEDLMPDVLIPPECASASRQHAMLDLRGDQPVLEDRSRYGTIVNGSRLMRGVMELSDRDEIIIGMPGDGWRVRFRHVDQKDVTTSADPLELLTVSENPRQIRIGREVIDENLGRDAFLLLKFLSENKGRWYPTDRLVEMLWPDPDRMPIAAKQALAQVKRRVNQLIGPHIQGEDAIVSAPFKGYWMKPHLDSLERSM